MIKCIYVIWCLCRNLLWVSSTRFEGFNEWCILWWKGRRKGLRRKVLAWNSPLTLPFTTALCYLPQLVFMGHFFGAGATERCTQEPANIIELLFLMCCAIWYHLYKLKNVKSTHGGVLLLVKLQVFAWKLLKVTLLHECFPSFLNYTNGSKSRNSPIRTIPYRLTIRRVLAKIT